MICPKCKANLQGELIYKTFLRLYKDKGEALRVAKLYGADEDTGWWLRVIQVYDAAKHDAISYQCPDCGHTWDRGEE